MTFERLAPGHWRATSRPCWHEMPEVVVDISGIKLRGSWPMLSGHEAQSVIAVLRKALAYHIRLVSQHQLDDLARRWVCSK